MITATIGNHGAKGGSTKKGIKLGFGEKKDEEATHAARAP